MHNAGLDAFMTGFIYLNYINKFTKFQIQDSASQSDSNILQVRLIEGLEAKFRNNVYLIGEKIIKF